MYVPNIFDIRRFRSAVKYSISTTLLLPGRRMCLGEQLTKMELFLLVSNIFLRYKVTFPDDYIPPEKDMDVIDQGIVRVCKPYTAIFTER